MGWVKVVATDLDGTIAENDRVDDATVSALQRLRLEGVRCVLVTGRTLSGLDHSFPGLAGEFDVVVAENGAVLRSRHVHRLLAEPVSNLLLARARQMGMHVEAGEVLLSCAARHDAEILQAASELGSDATLIRNRDRLMVLPAGVSKGTGLTAALRLLGLSRHNCVAFGDAENDHSMFDVAELAVATANAVPAIRSHADLTLTLDDGAGVREALSGSVISGERRLNTPRRSVEIGRFLDDSPATLPTRAATIVVTGGSGRGKSYFGGMLAEALNAQGYVFLMIDPEGEQSSLGLLDTVTARGAVTDHDLRNTVKDLRNGISVVLDLSQLNDPDRLDRLRTLAPMIRDLRNETGSPQWIFADEAHQWFSSGGPLRELFDPRSGSHCLTTYQPHTMCSEILADTDVVVSVGPPVDQLLGTDDHPAAALPKAVEGQAVLVNTAAPGPPKAFIMAERTTTHRRHRNKYAQAQLPSGKGFFIASSNPPMEIRSLDDFRRELTRLPSLALEPYLERGDLSRWLAEVVQDRALAARVGRIERRLHLKHLTDIALAVSEIDLAITDLYPEVADGAPDTPERQ